MLTLIADAPLAHTRTIARLRRVLLYPPRDSAHQRAVADLDHDRVERPGAQQLDADRSVPLGDRRGLAVGDEPVPWFSVAKLIACDGSSND
jgi:hypothetical protein